MVDINLSKSVRSNLSSLQNTASLMSKTSDRLSTGNKVNSALDNPTNFFTASSLNSRAGDLNQLMDSMANGIKTIEAADNGLSAITKNLESMQSTLRQARQDKSFKTETFQLVAAPATGTTLDISGGAVGATPEEILLNKNSYDSGLVEGTGLTDGAIATADAGKNFTLTDGDKTTEAVVVAEGDTLQSLSKKINAAAAKAGADISASVTDGKLVVSSLNGTVTAADDGATTGGATLLGLGTASEVAKTTDEMVKSINISADLKGKVRASNDNGGLRIENLSTQDLTVTGANGNGSIAGNTVRSDLAKQFNELRDQLDKLSDDASFNGINLLRGDNLKITFNETGSSSIDIQTKEGMQINSANLNLETTLDAADLDSDASIDGFIDQIKGALNQVRSQSSAFGSNLSVVQNRQDFTQKMINTLETGAGNLTLADMNQEAANMMALQTRQSLASSTLSMANQADQNVLQLLR